MSVVSPASRSQPARQIAADLLLWLVAALLGIAVLLLVRTWLTKIWFVQFLQPVITLSILTLVLHWRGESWRGLGLRKPTNWRRFLRHVIVGMLAVVSAAYVIRHVVIAPLHLRGSLRVAYLPRLQNNATALARLLVLVLLGVGLNEELLFRGFLQSRLAMAFAGTSGHFAAVVVTGAIFGVAHFAWGPANMVYAALLGMLLGGIYLWADGNLWVPVILHSLFDVTRAIQWFFTGNDLPT